MNRNTKDTTVITVKWCIGEASSLVYALLGPLGELVPDHFRQRRHASSSYEPPSWLSRMAL
jgi:hypothetical protein